MKLAAIALSFTVPLVLTTWSLVEEKNIKIEFAEQELRGDRYLRPLSRLLVHVSLHRTLVRKDDDDQASRTEALVDEDLDELLDVDGDVADELHTTSAALSARDRGAATPARLVESWETVKLAPNVAASDELHEQLIADIRMGVARSSS